MEDQSLVYEGSGEQHSCQGGTSDAEDISAGERVQAGLEEGGVDVGLAGLPTTTGP